MNNTSNQSSKSESSARRVRFNNLNVVKALLLTVITLTVPAIFFFGPPAWFLGLIALLGPYTVLLAFANSSSSSVVAVIAAIVLLLVTVVWLLRTQRQIGSGVGVVWGIVGFVAIHLMQF